MLSSCNSLGTSGVGCRRVFWPAPSPRARPHHPAAGRVALDRRGDPGQDAGEPPLVPGERALQVPTICLAGVLESDRTPCSREPLLVFLVSAASRDYREHEFQAGQGVAVQSSADGRRSRHVAGAACHLPVRRGTASCWPGGTAGRATPQHVAALIDRVDRRDYGEAAAGPLQGAATPPSRRGSARSALACCFPTPRTHSLFDGAPLTLTSADAVRGCPPAARAIRRAASYPRLGALHRRPAQHPHCPQRCGRGRHLHGLHARGREILEELFAGFTAALEARGAERGDVLRDIRRQLSGHQLAQAGYRPARPAGQPAAPRRPPAGHGAAAARGRFPGGPLGGRRPIGYEAVQRYG